MFAHTCGLQSLDGNNLMSTHNRWPRRSRPWWWSLGPRWWATSRKETRSTSSAWSSQTLLLPGQTLTSWLRRSSVLATTYKEPQLYCKVTTPQPNSTPKTFVFFFWLWRAQSLAFLSSPTDVDISCLQVISDNAQQIIIRLCVSSVFSSNDIYLKYLHNHSYEWWHKSKFERITQAHL